MLTSNRSSVALGRSLLVCSFLVVPFIASAEESRMMVLANTCASCHGTDGHSPGSIPALAGRSKKSIIEALKAFKNDKRPATVMNRLAKGYTDAEIEALAGYFARSN